MAAALYPHDVYHRLVGSDDPCTPLELPPGVPEVLVRADDDVVVLSAFLFEVAPGLHMMAGATPIGMVFSCPGRLALEGRPDGQRCTVLRTGCGDVFRVVKRVAHLNAFLDWAGPLTLTHASCIKRLRGVVDEMDGRQAAFFDGAARVVLAADSPLAPLNDDVRFAILRALWEALPFYERPRSWPGRENVVACCGETQ